MDHTDTDTFLIVNNHTHNQINGCVDASRRVQRCCRLCLFSATEFCADAKLTGGSKCLWYVAAANHPTAHYRLYGRDQFASLSRLAVEPVAQP